MLKIRRIYNQNKRGIWLVLLIIASIIIVIQLLNFIAKKQNEQRINTSLNISENTTKKERNLTSSSNHSVASSEKISSEELEKGAEVIEEFINYCKNGEIKLAYQMLTDECKEEMYTTQESFEKLYCSQIFQNNSNCSLENWNGNTYRIKVIGDILASGKINEGDEKQDYITVKRVEDGYKLNINGYIGREEINRTKEKEKITITVVSRDTYMDYEKYQIKVKNNSEHTILLDTLKDTYGMYIENDKGVKFSSYLQEVSIADLELARGHERNISIKYYSTYNEKKNIASVVFSNVVLNYDEKSTAMSEKTNIAVEI